MRRKTLASLLTISTMLVACGGRDTPANPDQQADPSDDTTCLYKGVVYQDQEEFKDDCNGCKCNPEGSTGVGCTAKNCDAEAVAPAPAPEPVEDRTCVYKGKVYQDQEEFVDSCNSCKCNPEGITGVSCTMKKCNVTTCTGNDACPAGSSCKPQYDLGVDPWDECEQVAGAYTLCHVGDDGDCAEGFYCADTDGLDDIKFGIGRCMATTTP